MERRPHQPGLDQRPIRERRRHRVGVEALEAAPQGEVRGGRLLRLQAARPPPRPRPGRAARAGAAAAGRASRDSARRARARAGPAGRATPASGRPQQPDEGDRDQPDDHRRHGRGQDRAEAGLKAIASISRRPVWYRHAPTSETAMPLATRIVARTCTIGMPPLASKVRNCAAARPSAIERDPGPEPGQVGPLVGEVGAGAGLLVRLLGADDHRAIEGTRRRFNDFRRRVVADAMTRVYGSM